MNETEVELSPLLSKYLISDSLSVEEGLEKIFNVFSQPTYNFIIWFIHLWSIENYMEERQLEI